MVQISAAAFQSGSADVHSTAERMSDGAWRRGRALGLSSWWCFCSSVLCSPECEGEAGSTDTRSLLLQAPMCFTFFEPKRLQPISFSNPSQVRGYNIHVFNTKLFVFHRSGPLPSFETK
ncbi:hypothetical protein D5086_014137 [Populus alba]|uniref:Uncharacterized protein n=1 Tax=Populus alba TaxID=43335 RepID=A0ACC4C8N4_POPAL